MDDDKSQVSVIGKNIVKLNGMLKKTFAPLKKCNVYMISQGASFVNISFVVDREELVVLYELLSCLLLCSLKLSIDNVLRYRLC